MNIKFVVIIPIESPNKQMNLVAFSNAIKVDGISKLFQTLSLLQDTFQIGVGWMMMSAKEMVSKTRKKSRDTDVIRERVHIKHKYNKASCLKIAV